MTAVMPIQKPGRSVQEVGTPAEFLRAVEGRFGRIAFDLAATTANHVAPYWYGPGGVYLDALASDVEWDAPGLQWLNPPYADIAPWAEKAATYVGTGALIAMLIPAAIGTNYFRQHIHGKALVLALSPRPTFVGHTQSYPKDLILCLYGKAPGFDCWRWK